jgi:hypothetical protein
MVLLCPTVVRTTLLAVGIVAALLGSSPAHAAAVYYLSPIGDNGNTGTQASPWKTFAFAGSLQATP